MAADTSVDARFTPVLPGANAELETFAEEYLDDLYTTYVISPTLSFGAGYVF